MGRRKTKHLGPRHYEREQWWQGYEAARKAAAENAKIDQQQAARPTPPALPEPPTPQHTHVPDGWPKGALLNVRNYGNEYIVTLYPEEFHVEHPERALRYENVGELQDFVSRWYAREHYDPRAR